MSKPPLDAQPSQNDAPPPPSDSQILDEVTRLVRMAPIEQRVRGRNTGGSSGDSRGRFCLIDLDRFDQLVARRVGRR